MNTLLFLSVFAIPLSTALGIEDVQAPATKTLPAPGPDGMIELSGRTRGGAGYTYSTFRTSFANAIESCKTSGRKLLAIEDLAEQQQVSILLASYSIDTRTWTSGMEISPGYYVWASTFEPLVYNNIGSSNPHQNSNCLTILNSGSNRFKWWHTNCTWEYHFMCENK